MHDCTNNLATVANGVYTTGCYTCIERKQSAEFAHKFNRDRMKENHRKDLLQRWNGDKPNPDYLRAYPEKSREYFTEDEIRKYS
jgi:hypothetical protein